MAFEKLKIHNAYKEADKILYGTSASIKDKDKIYEEKRNNLSKKLIQDAITQIYFSSPEEDQKKLIDNQINILSTHYGKTKAEQEQFLVDRKKMLEKAKQDAELFHKDEDEYYKQKAQEYSTEELELLEAISGETKNKLDKIDDKAGAAHRHLYDKILQASYRKEDRIYNTTERKKWIVDHPLLACASVAAVVCGVVTFTALGFSRNGNLSIDTQRALQQIALGNIFGVVATMPIMGLGAVERTEALEEGVGNLKQKTSNFAQKRAARLQKVIDKRDETKEKLDKEEDKKIEALEEKTDKRVDKLEESRHGEKADDIRETYRLLRHVNDEYLQILAVKKAKEPINANAGGRENV